MHVSLPSGKRFSIDLKVEAQRLFQRRFLWFAFGGQPLDPSATLREVGLQDGA